MGARATRIYTFAHAQAFDHGESACRLQMRAGRTRLNQALVSFSHTCKHLIFPWDRYKPHLVKSDISIIIMHIFFARIIMSLPLSSHLVNSLSSFLFSSCSPSVNCSILAFSSAGRALIRDWRRIEIISQCTNTYTCTQLDVFTRAKWPTLVYAVRSNCSVTVTIQMWYCLLCCTRRI